MIGRVVSDRYRIVRKLGEGGVGGVYFAEHLLVNRKVALKVLLPDVSRPEMVELFLEEARTVARIGHENVIDIFYGGRSPDGFVFLAMEYLEGVDLAALLKAGPLPWERARPILKQVAAALAAVHQHGIVHRDIKPENVFLIERDGRSDFVKLLDFGVAVVAAGGSELDTGQGLISGTPEYMAPEQAQAGRIDHRADVYSLGCVMYHAVTGEPPFKAQSILHLLSKHLHEAPVPPSERRPDLAISAEIDAVVMRALQKDPADRWPDMRAFGEAIERARQTGKSNPREKPRPVLRVDDTASHARGRTRRRAATLLAAGAVLAAAGIGYKAFTTAPGHVQIDTTPADATVVFNDVTVTTGSPVLLDAPPGTYQLAVSRPGYLPVQQRVHVPARATLRLPIALQPAAGASAAAGDSAADQPGAAEPAAPPAH